MTLDEILRDIHILEMDLQNYERKYGVLSETFFEPYSQGEEPEDDALGDGLVGLGRDL